MKAFIQYFLEGFGLFIILFALCVVLIPYIYFIFGIFPWFFFIFPFLGWFCDSYISWKQDYYNRRVQKKENTCKDNEEYY